jgi:ABC-2 type transport system ATP-binding protein
MVILEVRDLVKHYHASAGVVRAVNGVNFSIREGICFGLLGPNGAGKTTTLEVIEGITQATSGQILFRGKEIGPDFRQRTGIQFQATSLPDYLTVQEVLTMFRSLYRSHADLQELARFCALEEFWERDTHRLSGGQRQRVLLALALVNDPDLIFLDEPTTGLDPQARRNFWDLVRTIKQRGKTVVLTTHYMEEAYALCDEIAIMDHGKILAHGAPDALLKKHFDKVFIEVPQEDFGKAELKDGDIRNGYVEIKTGNVNAALKDLIDQGVTLSRMRVRPHTLEDLFLELTGKNLRG